MRAVCLGHAHLEAAALYCLRVVCLGHAHLEAAALYCLSLLKATLEKQERFLGWLRETNASTMVSQVDKLLMGINPRSGKADHLLNVAK